MPRVLNISTYRFAALGGLKSLRGELMDRCKEWNLKGTILLSPEGINLFVAGGEEGVEALVRKLEEIPGLSNLDPKRSWSDDQPFRRMLVRLKKEIIAFGIESVRPADYTSRKIAPRDLKKWLDEGRPVTLLDTRNDYEVRLGTFRGAVDPQIRTFRSFPDAVRRLPDDWKERPIVMFCTGGIRCEKAGPFMEAEGFRDVYQLDGGILRYFEECGGEHYDGDCFVFDQRVGVDPALRETTHAVCHACLAPLDDEDQRDPRFIEGKSCPHCFRGDDALLEERIRSRQARVDQVCRVLPGAVAREMIRPVSITPPWDGALLIDALCGLFPQIPAAEWERRCEEGRFRDYAGTVRGRDHRVRAGQRLLQWFPPEVEPDVATGIRVIYEDEALLVVAKPAPLPMHSGGRYHRNTLHHLLSLACEPHVVRLVHRLDSNTSGVVVFARTRHFAGVVARQFAGGTVEKTYLARLAGHPKEDCFECSVALADEPEAAGSRSVDEDGPRAALTTFEVLSRDDDGTALCRVRPMNGRTHQIRLHARHLGFPIVGDPFYGESAVAGEPMTLSVGDPPMMLHAWRLAIDHPRTGKRMVFEADAPEWTGHQSTLVANSASAD